MDLRTYMFGGVTRSMAYKGLDAAAVRSRAIADNLANVSTPGYRRLEVSFEDELKKVLNVKIEGRSTDDQHIDIVKGKLLEKVRPEIYESPDPTLPGEVNNVDVDLEGAKLAETQIMYRYMLKFVGFSRWNAVISGSPQTS